MAQNDKKISELPDGTKLVPNSYFVSADYVNDEWITQKHSAGEVANKIFNSFAYINKLDTTSDIPIGAINEVSDKLGISIDGVLEAGQSSITFQNSHITANSMIDWYCAQNPTSITISTGQIVLTFDEQDNDMVVKVVIF